MAVRNIIDQVVSASPNRRSLLKKLGIASAAVTAAGSAGALRLNADPTTPSPIDVIQFALNLEYLEAEFYSIATTGATLEKRGIDISGTGTPGPTTTKYGQVAFTNNTLFTSAIAVNIATDELAHVRDLRTALLDNGITPVAKPALNLDALDPAGASLQNEQTFLVLSRIFEDVGVSAYAGGAPLLASDAGYLQLAARILAVEGEHVANVRLQLGKLGITSPKLDGADVVPPPVGQNYFSTNFRNGLCAVRTPGEVLYLAYGNQAGVQSGGFFPSGLNGSLVTSTAPATSANLN
jgi:Ferritin-like domain